MCSCKLTLISTKEQGKLEQLENPAKLLMAIPGPSHYKYSGSSFLNCASQGINCGYLTDTESSIDKSSRGQYQLY